MGEGVNFYFVACEARCGRSRILNFLTIVTVKKTKTLSKSLVQLLHHTALPVTASEDHGAWW